MSNRPGMVSGSGATLVALSGGVGLSPRWHLTDLQAVSRGARPAARAGGPQTTILIIRPGMTITFFGVASVLIGFPLIWEATTHCGLLAPPLSALTLGTLAGGCFAPRLHQ